MGIIGTLSIWVVDASIYSVIRPNVSEDTVTVTYNANNWAFSDNSPTKSVEYYKNANDLYVASGNTQAPERDGYMFVWWYLQWWDAASQTTEWYWIQTDTTETTKTVYAKWLPFENKTVDLWEIGSFDIMDRNLWAAVSGTGNNENAYWFYYQWWNNYGFINSWSVPYLVSTQINITWKWYWPWNYYSSATFVKRLGSPNRWDTDTGSTTYTTYGNLNLWWWENTSNPDSWRQWPCPENYHVPDALERRAAYNLFKSWADTVWSGYCNTLDDNTTYRAKCFASKLALPFAGRRVNDGSTILSKGTYGYYWSSVPYPAGTNSSYYLQVGSYNIYPNSNEYGRANGFSVRCFKNSSTKALTFNANGWTVDTNITQTVRRWENWTALPTPTNSDSHKEFKWWYTTSDFSWSAVTTNALSTDDSGWTITLYAKWDVDCPDGEEYVESKGKCIPSRAIIRDSVSWEIIQINDMEWDDLELYFLSWDWTTKHFTIMDRNLWASEPYNQQFVRDSASINTDSFWYHYQWWNNYWFEPCINSPLTSNLCATFPKSETTVWTIAQNIWSAYMPSKYARNTLSNSENWMSSSSTGDNIRWWGWDTISSNHDSTLIWNNNDWSILSWRQWPCPEWYYIPSTYDWTTIKNAWWDSVASASNWTQFASDLLLPPAGYRNFSEKVISQGYIGLYWSSSPSPSNPSNAHSLDVNSFNILPQRNYYRSYGYSVRCAKSYTNTSTFTLYANGWSKAVVAFTGTVGDGRFTTLWTPTKSWGYEFDWWYTKDWTDDDWWDKLWVWSGVVANIYAKWIQPKSTVTFNTTINWGNEPQTGSVQVTNWEILYLSEYIATKTDWNFIWWNTNSWAHDAMSSLTVTEPITLYAIFKKEWTTLTWTIISNWATVTETGITCNIPTIYNNQSEVTECTLDFPAATRTNGIVYGYSTTNTQTVTPAIANDWTGNISASTTFYVISKEVLTWTFYLNWNTSQTPYGGSESTAESVTTTCDLWNDETSCNITTPTFEPANWKTAKWYTTDEDVSGQTNPTYTSTGTPIALTANAQYYAQSKSDDIVLNINYLSWVWVQLIWKNNDSCILTWTWNSATQATSCTVEAPTITLKDGYWTWIWSTWNNEVNPLSDIPLTADDTYTASATPNDNTQYTVEHYFENIDGTWFDIDDSLTDNLAWTTDTHTWAEYKVVLWFTWSVTTSGAESSGNIAWNGSLILKLYYTRNNYTLTFDSNSGSVASPITAKYWSWITLPESTRTWYIFTWWKDENDVKFYSWDVYTLSWDTTLTWQWIAGTYVVTFDVNGWNALTPNTWLVTYDAAYWTLPTPSRNGYSFNGWFTAATNGTKITATTVVSATWDHTLYAQWTQNPVSWGSSSGWGSSWWGWSSKAKTSSDSVTSTEIQTWSKVDSSTKATDNDKASEWQNQWKTYSDEFQQAYEFAYKHGITTMPTIEQANMEGPLTRIAMAKMLSYYAINVLWLKPDETRVNKFNDVSDQMDAEYNNAVSLAYQLWIMWINIPNNKFRPNDLVTRAEFATALSRMLYKIADWKDKYYSTHLAKLMEEKIITNDNPNLQELRGYVMIMLMRSAK